MKKGFMELGLFKNIIGQLKTSLVNLNLYSWGEPLLNPDFVEMIRYAKQVIPGVRIVTSTNLNINDDLLLEKLIRSGADEIIISCDGISQESYSKYRVGGDFDLVMRNIKTLLHFRDQFKSKVHLVWNFIVFKHNENEVGRAKEAARSMGIDLRIGKMRTSMKEEILRPHAESIQKYKNWIPDNPEYSAYDLNKGETKIKIKSCRKPWAEMSINWNGDVFPCCAVYGDEYRLGSIKSAAIREVWNSAPYKLARQEVLNRGCKVVTICGICRDNGFMHM